MLCKCYLNLGEIEQFRLEKEDILSQQEEALKEKRRLENEVLQAEGDVGGRGNVRIDASHKSFAHINLEAFFLANFLSYLSTKRIRTIT